MGSTPSGHQHLVAKLTRVVVVGLLDFSNWPPWPNKRRSAVHRRLSASSASVATAAAAAVREVGHFELALRLKVFADFSPACKTGRNFGGVEATPADYDYARDA